MVHDDSMAWQLTGPVPVSLAACCRLSHLCLADNRLEGDLASALVYHWICNDSLRYLNLSGNPLLLLASYDPFLTPSTMATLTATTTADVTRGGVGSSSSVSGYGGGGIGSSGSGSGIDGGSGGSGGGKGQMVEGILESDLRGAPASLFRKLHRWYGAASMTSAARGLIAATEGDLREVGC